MMKITLSRDQKLVAVSMLAALLIFRRPVKSEPTAPIDETQLSFSIAQFQIFANEIEAAIWTGWTENEAIVVSVMLQMQTTEDVVKLAQIYGKRPQDSTFRKPIPLFQTLESYLSSGDISSINQHFNEKGIAFQI